MQMPKTLTAIALLLVMLIGLPSRAALELNEGDSIVVVGNTFAERLALSGYFDAMVHAANPDKQIVVRSVPNSADEVDQMPREHSVPEAEFYLKRHGADVVVMCFGMSESFDGLGGVDAFKDGLTKQVENHVAAEYNGESAPQIVLVSPIAHEDLGGNWPTGEEVVQRNTVLEAYTEAMKQVAAEQDAHFIDLYTPSFAVYEKKDKPANFTNNGIAPTEFGCFFFAGEMAKQLGWWDGEPAADSGDAGTLRQVAYDKHYHWRHRYRATNTEYVWGRRHKPFGVVNFPPELEQLDKMVAAREAAMWEMDKPALGELFASAPTGKALWETPPTSYDYPGDDYEGVEIPQKQTDRAVGDPNKIAPPEDYLDTFKVADGYQVNLFASEREFPELQNPLAMTFDYQGRLWVLCSPTYPHPFPGEVSDCKLVILDDTDGDGKADKSTIFARNMVIPTGFVVDPDGVAYVGQAPDLWKLTDTDGDDVADRKEIVYSGFGMPDSHHTISAFVWDPHGGILMSEGVFTRTNIETPFGTQRTRDAAVWRYDPRNNKLIAISHTGHPNPWGHTFDQYGQSIYMDTSGARQYNFSSMIAPYLGFEKPPKGPPVVSRGRPTAGSEIIYSSHFPDKAQGTYVHSQCIGFLGTHWDRLKEDGANNSGYTSEPMPQPILASDIGNYRPVTSELGADGALYIADWVNPLIGHMQFNLRDPRRDHTHGRIYRVTHKERDLVDRIDLTELDINGLLETFKLPEQNTRDRARRILQTMDADKVAEAAEAWLFEQNPREDWYERASLEVLWAMQGAGKLDMKIVDEAMRAREPLVQAGAIRALRIGLQFGDLTTKDCQPFIAQAVNNRDMRVRLEAVMACAYLDTPQAVDLANMVANQPMDGPIRNAHAQTIKYLEAKGFESEKGLSAIYNLPQEELAAAAKKKLSDDLVAKAVLARPDLPEADRRAALAALADTPAQRGEVLMQTAKNTRFDPAKTARAITPFLLDLPTEAVFAISDDLDDLLDSSSEELRSAAVILKVRAGAPLPELADRDPTALLSAVQSLPKDLAPPNVPGDLFQLAQSGVVEPGVAFQEAARLTSDTASLFERFASLIDKAQAIGYEKWSNDHRLAIAALGAMHQIEDAAWPEGFERYRIARADEQTLELGRETYYHEEKGCVKCHGHHGEGTEGFPPLAGSPWVLGSPERAATIVKYGLQGELAHLTNPTDGKPFSAQMEPLSYMSDPQIAAVLTFARQRFGNFAEPVTVEHVSAAPQPEEGANMWHADALLEAFPFERDRVLGSAPPPQFYAVRWSAPSLGVLYVLAGVTVTMLLILVVTWLGGRPARDASQAGPALA